MTRCNGDKNEDNSTGDREARGKKQCERARRDLVFLIHASVRGNLSHQNKINSYCC